MFAYVIRSCCDAPYAVRHAQPDDRGRGIHDKDAAVRCHLDAVNACFAVDLEYLLRGENVLIIVRIHLYHLYEKSTKKDARRQ